MITQERLMGLFHYNPDDGVFTRLVVLSNNTKIGDVAGSIGPLGYLRISIDNRSYACHRLAFLYMTNAFPENDTDHINGVRHDNRWVNLRSVSHKDNQKNQKVRKSNKTGHIGVYWREDTRKWSVRIGVNGRLLALGCFSDINDAVAARKAAQEKHGFHENHGGRQ